MIQEQIRKELTDAMKHKDGLRLTVIRGILTAFTNELVSLKRTPQSALTDEEAIAVIRRAIKQRKDSIEQYTKGGRPELADAEKSELSILETYVPQLMSREDVLKIAMAKKTEMGLTEKGQAGVLMATLMKELRGKADGAVVKDAIETLF